MLNLDQILAAARAQKAYFHALGLTTGSFGTSNQPVEVAFAVTASGGKVAFDVTVGEQGPKSNKNGKLYLRIEPRPCRLAFPAQRFHEAKHGLPYDKIAMHLVDRARQILAYDTAQAAKETALRAEQEILARLGSIGAVGRVYVRSGGVFLDSIGPLTEAQAKYLLEQVVLVSATGWKPC